MMFVVKGQFTTAFLAAMQVLCFGNIAQPAFAAPPASSATLAALAESFVDARFELNPLMGTMITGNVRYAKYAGRDGQGCRAAKVLMARVLPQLKSQMVSDPAASGFYVPAKNFPPAFGEAHRVRLSAAYRKTVEEKITPVISKLHDLG